MRTRVAGASLAVLAAVALSSGEARAQQQGGAAAQQQDTTELVFQREVFDYPSFERRDPFAELLGAGDTGPRFEELRLLGIIHSPQPEMSVALLAAGAGGGPQGAMLQQTYRVRQGQTLGNSRILEIQESRVIVEVTEFGITEQRVLELQRPAAGGSP